MNADWTPPVEAVEAGVDAVTSIIPNTNGVLWMVEHDDGQQEPVTLAYAMQVALTAARGPLVAEVREELTELIATGDDLIEHGAVLRSDFYGLLDQLRPIARGADQ